MTDAPRRRTAARALTALAVCAGLLVSGTVAQADTREDLVEQRQQNAEERERLEASLEGVDTDLAATYLALEDAKQRLPLAEAELARAQEDLAAAERTQQQVADRLELAEAEQESLTAEIAEAQEQIAGSQEALGELARSTYRGGTSMGTLRVVLDATSTEDFMRQYTVMDTAVRSQTQVLDDLENAAAITRNRQERQDAVTERITELKAEADAAVVAADEARAEAARRTEEIRQLKATQEELAEELEGRRDTFEDEIAGLDESDSELAAEIARIDEENRRRAAEEARRQAEAERQRQAEDEAARRAQAERDAAASRGSSGGTQRSGGSVSSGSAFTTPVPNPMWVTSRYGMRLHPLAKIWWMHEGVDVRSACGNPQYSAAKGTVAATRPAPGNDSHGNQVLVNHGIINGSSYVTVYNHLSRFAVRQGQGVGKGQVIGYTGATGNVTGCHVHFEVWRDGATIDPMDLPGYVQAN